MKRQLSFLIISSDARIDERSISLLPNMSQLPPKKLLTEEVMDFLEKIETSFQEAETFFQEATTYLQGLEQKDYSQDLAETIQYIQKAKSYVSNLRQSLPAQLDAKEAEIIKDLIKSRANRKIS